jgi:hypothetical protein
LFDRPEEVYSRLQGYALGAGFAAENYWCIHHATWTRNDRKLSESVEKDPANPKVIVISRSDSEVHIVFL